jgi:hypothetical protein
VNAVKACGGACVRFSTLTFSPSYIGACCLYIAVGIEPPGPCAVSPVHKVIFFRESPMKTSLKKALVLLVLAAFAAPSLSFAAASYPNNKPRPSHHKKHHKHHSKKAAPAQ